MKRHDSIAKAMVSGFEAGDGSFLCNRPLCNNHQAARQIFASDRKNPLTVSMDMLCTIVTSIHQKFVSCRMDGIYRAEPKEHGYE